MFFCDNEGAKHGLVRGHSPVVESARIVGAFWIAAGAADAPTWVARVASASNPADAPSRGAFFWEEVAGWQVDTGITPPGFAKQIGHLSGQICLR